MLYGIMKASATSAKTHFSEDRKKGSFEWTKQTNYLPAPGSAPHQALSVLPLFDSIRSKWKWTEKIILVQFCYD